MPSEKEARARSNFLKMPAMRPEGTELSLATWLEPHPEPDFVDSIDGGHFGTILGPCWNHFGTIWGTCWGHIGTIVVSNTDENNKTQTNKKTSEPSMKRDPNV